MTERLPNSGQRSPKWLALIVTKPDGSEECPICISGTDPLTGPIEISRIRVEGSSHLIGLIKRQGPITGYRFEELSGEEIIERGYRENPPL